MSSANPAADRPWKPGTIRKIKLNNFMCHEHFELPFGPNVNFIIGPNGSGKSALLTALVTALGGRATITSRAKKMSEFIMYGKSHAKITVVIHNYETIMEKEHAFKPDDYGKFITIEKLIYNDEASSRLVLRNDRDKKVSERKQELDEMLEHFGILINNPICILNQEVSKTFLHSKNPKDKFELFMKATNLEQIENDYKSAEASHKEWSDGHERTAFAFKQLDKESAACKEKVKFIEQRAHLGQDKEKLVNEHIWAQIRDNEKLCEEFSNKIASVNNTIQESKKVLENKADKKKQHQADLINIEERLNVENKRIEDNLEKRNKINAKITTNSRKKIDARAESERLKLNVERLEREKGKLEKTIADFQKQDSNELNRECGLRKVKISTLEKELESEKDRERALRLHTNQLSESMSSIKSELNGANARVNEIKSKITVNESESRRLKNGEENSIRKYGDFVVKIRDEIEKYAQRNMFSRKPIGPIGYHLKLKSQDIATALEVHIGKTAHAFVCDNHRDSLLLKKIFNQVASSGVGFFRFPMIITRPFTRRHDASRYKARHPDYKTLLDYLQIEEDAIYNVLVDRNFIESVLFIPDYRDAENLMLNPNEIPPHTRIAYTKDGQMLHPKNSQGGFRSFAPSKKRYNLFSESNLDRIRELEKELEMLRADQRDAEALSKRIEEGYRVQRSEYDENNAEIRKVINIQRQKEEALLELKAQEVAHAPQQAQELAVYERELDDVISMIVRTQKSLASSMKIMADLEEEHQMLLKDLEDFKELAKKHEEAKSRMTKEKESTLSSIAEIESTTREHKRLIETSTIDRDKIQKIYDSHLAMTSQFKVSTNLENRPKHIRSTEEIKEELRKIEALLKAQDEEMQDPEEVRRNLYKRMDEIKNLKNLKSMNQSNLNTASTTLDGRREGLANLQRITIGSVSATFTSVMRPMGMNGQLKIYLDDHKERGEVVKNARTLEMLIDTNYTGPSQRTTSTVQDITNDGINSRGKRRQTSSSQQPLGQDGGPLPKRSRTSATGQSANEKENERIKMTDARSLSGGERSFSTVSFVLALWHHCASPFKLMDEIDVFMDMVTRRISYNSLVRFAQMEENAGQFIFFSPLELPKIDNSTYSVRVFEMPMIVRKRPMSQTAAAAGGDKV